MNNSQDISEIIFACIDNLNKQLPANGKLAKTSETILLGEGGVLDSLGLITLCVSMEEAISGQTGVNYALLDELMSERGQRSLQSIGSMMEWIKQQARTAA